MRTELVEEALKAAQTTRGSLAGAIFHSDHGSVYTSAAYARLCADHGVTQSMGAVGTSADDGLAESFNATLKREILQDQNCWPDDAVCHSSPGVPLDRALQHPPPTLLLRPHVPDHLRDHRYASAAA